MKVNCYVLMGRNFFFIFCLFGTYGIPLHPLGGISKLYRSKIFQNNHKHSLNHEDSDQNTALATYFWKLKNEGKDPKVSFKIHKLSKSFNPEINRCNLCNDEKIAILNADPKFTLNKRTEIMSKCRHRSKFILAQLNKPLKPPKPQKIKNSKI